MIAAGKPLHFITTIVDITERKQAETALQKSETRLRAVLDATPFPIAIVDVQDNNISYWSRSALTLFGHTAPTATEWYEIAYPDPDYRRDVVERWKPFLEKARASGMPVNTGEYRVTCRDGSVRICELYATFLEDNLIVTFNDISERKQAETDMLVSVPAQPGPAGGRPRHHHGGERQEGLHLGQPGRDRVFRRRCHRPRGSAYFEGEQEPIKRSNPFSTAGKVLYAKAGSAAATEKRLLAWWCRV